MLRRWNGSWGWREGVRKVSSLGWVDVEVVESTTRITCGNKQLNKQHEWKVKLLLCLLVVRR